MGAKTKTGQKQQIYQRKRQLGGWEDKNVLVVVRLFAAARHDAHYVFRAPELEPLTFHSNQPLNEALWYFLKGSFMTET